LLPLLAALGTEHLTRRLRRLGKVEVGTLGLLLALTAIVVIWDWRSVHEDLETQRRSVLENGLIRSAFLFITGLLLVLFFRSAGNRKIVCGCALLLVFWLDFATHVPSQSLTVPLSAYSPGWARDFLKWNSGPRLGESRAMVAPATQRVLAQYVHPNPN